MQCLLGSGTRHARARIIRFFVHFYISSFPPSGQRHSKWLQPSARWRHRFRDTVRWGRTKKTCRWTAHLVSMHCCRSRRAFPIAARAHGQGWVRHPCRRVRALLPLVPKLGPSLEVTGLGAGEQTSLGPWCQRYMDGTSLQRSADRVPRSSDLIPSLRLIPSWAPGPQPARCSILVAAVPLAWRGIRLKVYRLKS